jgi:twitching motility protein PilU
MNPRILDPTSATSGSTSSASAARSALVDPVRAQRRAAVRSAEAASVLLDLVMEKRGIVLVAAHTGSGKSTTLAAMIDHRNTNRTGHILTIEDRSSTCSSTSRASSTSARSASTRTTITMALPNALREAPDLIMIGEIRDKENDAAALLHTLTGHLCLSTIHANNSYHALSRIINLFPHDARSAVLSDLSIGLRAIVSQRLVRNATASCSRRSRSCSTRR